MDCDDLMVASETLIVKISYLPFLIARINVNNLEEVKYRVFSLSTTR